MKIKLIGKLNLLFFLFIYLIFIYLISFLVLVKGGECDSLNQVDSDVCTECIKKNRDMIVGVKVRLSASAANDGINEEEAFRFVFTLDLVSTVIKIMAFCPISFCIVNITLSQHQNLIFFKSWRSQKKKSFRSS